MAMDYTTGYAQIVKYDKNDDGTLTVYGKATDDTLDLDSQICDPKWLDTAMPRWFKSGGNIREMHGPSAAGIAKEYEAKGDGHYINVLVVDPLAAKKVETGVYQGFSIGIKSPRVIQDSKAANGRIIDGQIIEVSLVDRPANPSAKLILAKTVEGEASLVQVEELVEKHGDHDQSSHGGGGGEGKPSGGESSDKPTPEQAGAASPISAEDIADYQSSTNAMGGDVQDLISEMENSEFDTDQIESAQEAMNAIGNAQESLQAANNTDDENERYDHLTDAYDSLNEAHGALSDVEHGSAEDIQDGLGELMGDLDEALGQLNPDHEPMYMSASVKSTTTKGKSKMRKIKRITELAKSLTTADAAKFDKSLFDNARRALAELIASEALEMREGHDERNSLSALAGAVEALMAWYEGEEHEGEVMEIEEEVKADMPDCEDGKCGKCAACMSDKAPKVPDTTEEEESDQAPDTMERDDEGKKKSADAEETTEDSVTEEVTDTPAEETPAEEVPTIEEVVEKAVKSAMKSVEAEMVALRADKEAAVTKAVELETELSNALNKAVAGGPKRTATKLSDQSQNDALVKAAAYKAKMDATTDPLLYKGYSDLRNAQLQKAGLLNEDN